MKASDRAGLDTNILVYADNTDSPHQAASAAILADAVSGRLKACLPHQVLAEYFAVVTSPRRVQNPLSPNEARQRVLFLLGSEKLTKILPRSGTLAKALNYCEERKLRGQAFFDTYLGWTLLDHGVKRILTFNVQDFDQLPGLQAEAP